MAKISNTSKIKIRRAKERGHANLGWLDSYHTFSFADYYDEEYMGFRSLRVINEDWVDAAKGFGMHPHRDMEIVTCVLEGALEHKDSMGNTSVIRPGDIQRMSAGTGVTHSEFNHSKKEPVHLLQIWIMPAQTGQEPSYEQKNFPPKRNSLQLVASAKGEQGAIAIHQDVKIYDGQLEKGNELTFSVGKNRRSWIQVKQGEVGLNGSLLRAGDGAAVENESLLRFQTENNASFLLFDLS